MTERTRQNPDPADPEDLRLSISQQGVFLELLYGTISLITAVQEDLICHIQGITQTLTEQTGQFANPATGSYMATSDIISTPTSVSGWFQSAENLRLQPEPFFGDVEACSGFLLQCQLIFRQAPRYYQSDHSKITLIVNSLRIKALQWAQAFISANPITHLQYEHFINEFRLIFDQPRRQEEATRRLINLKQRGRSVSDHLIDFRILAVEAGWQDIALKGIFYQSLNDSIKDHLCTQPEANTFEDLVSAALRSDIRLRERHHERQVNQLKTINNHPLPVIPAQLQAKSDQVPCPKPTEEPMQVGHSKLSAEERQRRRMEGSCFYCGAQGHLVSQCKQRLNSTDPPLSDRPQGKYVSAQTSATFLYLPVKICTKTDIHSTRALIDSGAEQSLIDLDLVTSLRLPTDPLETPVEASGLGGQPLSRITHRTKPVQILISGNHRENIQFFITRSKHTPIILGYSWLKLHNPQFNWCLGHITNWRSYCLANCLASAIPSTSHPSPEPSSDSNLDKIPACYHDLHEVFSKTKACALPSHRPYDCEINLQPGSTLPKGRLFNLSRPERLAMESYVQEALSLGHIRPSSSPVGAGFFFVEKKDKTLRPCIDYRELNQITIKDKYALPLISTVFDSVQEARIFTKLDLRNAYHLIRMKEGDEWKTAFHTPLGHYEYLVMPFGLTNAPAVFQRLVNDVLRDFLNRFVFVYLDDILIYSENLTQHEQHVRQVLTRLLENQLFVKLEKCEFHVDHVQFLGYIIEPGHIRPDPAKIEAVANWEPPSSRKKLQQFLSFANFYRRFIRNYSSIAAPLTRLTSTSQNFSWTPEAQEAFDRLKGLFVSAPILIQPDPSRQFVVEVDASDSGVGAVLSQKNTNPVSSSLAPFSLKSCHPQSKTTTWGTGNCWLSSWPLRSGGTGWRERNTLSWFGPTIKTWHA
uniref:ribonuclease H n=1 Tax=Oryzias sinensis TaxID=183150 RepID=A0A8C7Y809_9TELE